MPAYLAVDLGAESGRVLRGDFDGSRLAVAEVHRFPNAPLRLDDGLFWDIERLYGEAVAGIARGISQGPGTRSVGVDAWGNDFGLLDGGGALLARSWHHRTPRTDGMVRRLLDLVDADEVYAITGTQFLPITMACQLLAMQGSHVLERADQIAMIPDLFTSWLSQRRVAEQTIASTSQLWDISRGRWAGGLLERLGIDDRLFASEVLLPGTRVGEVAGAAARAVESLSPVGVVAVAGHDTACAVAAVPAESAGFAYVSCGTWSLVGLEIDHPLTTSAARHGQFTNEVGVDGTVRFHSNVNGLWLVQECRRVWAASGAPVSYAALTAQAWHAPAFRSLIDPDDPTLLGAGDMPDRIARLCRATGEPVPTGQGQVVRCILDSLACKYRWVLERASTLVGRSVEVVHLVGGGAANSLLCQQTADLTGRPVVAGPIEATGVGNLLIQAMADGRLSGLADIRSVVRASIELRVYDPSQDGGAADDAYGRFQRVVSRKRRLHAQPERQVLTPSATT